MRLVMFILVICGAIPVSFGQSLKDTVKLKEVFVTSARQVTERALHIRTIDSVVLINAITADLSDLLQKNSSLYIKSYGAGGLATASFRGTSASHTQVLWNGLNINSPLWGQTDLSLLPVFFTDEVSLLYGSSSLSKTAGGLGGCISLLNTPSWNEGKKVSFAQTVGSFGYYLSQLKISYSRGKIVANTRIFYDKAKNDFRYYDNASGMFDYSRQKNADYKKNGFLQEVYYKINTRQFAGVKFMNTWTDRNLPQIMSFRGAERNENQKDNNVNVIGEWKYYGSKSNWSVNSGYIRNGMGYKLTSSNPGGTVVNYDTRSVSNMVSGKVNFQYNFSDKTILKTSADAIFTEAEYMDMEADTGFHVNRTDVTLQSSVHYVFSPLFTGYLLAQQKVLNGEIMPFIAAAGFEYHLMPDRELTLKTNIGRNLHVPNLNDIYFFPGGNLNLKPEIGYQSDVSLQWKNVLDYFKYNLEVTGFAAWIDNWILWHPSEFRYWTADNVQRVFSRGAEVNGSLIGDFERVSYQLKGNYSFTRTTNEEKESSSYGMQLIYIPKHIGNIHLHLKRKTYSAIFSWHFTGARFASTTENKVHQVSSYNLLDVGLGKTFRVKTHSLDLNFRLNNALNKQYQVIEQRAMPGRNFSVSLSLNLSSE